MQNGIIGHSTNRMFRFISSLETFSSALELPWIKRFRHSPRSSTPRGQLLTVNALWVMHEINRIDKHRRISIRMAYHGVPIHEPIREIRPFDNGCEILVSADA